MGARGPKPTGVPAWLDLDRLAATTPADGWRDDAACNSLSWDVFFPVSQLKGAYDDALDICDRCPVRLDCVATYLGEQHGCFGTTTPGEREAIRQALELRERGAA